MRARSRRGVSRLAAQAESRTRWCARGATSDSCGACFTHARAPGRRASPGEPRAGGNRPARFHRRQSRSAVAGGRVDSDGGRVDSRGDRVIPGLSGVEGRPGAASVVAEPARGRVLAPAARAVGRHRGRLWRGRADGEGRQLFLDALAAARWTRGDDPLAHERLEASSALGTAEFEERHGSSIPHALRRIGARPDTIAGANTALKPCVGRTSVLPGAVTVVEQVFRRGAGLQSCRGR